MWTLYTHNPIPQIPQGKSEANLGLNVPQFFTPTAYFWEQTEQETCECHCPQYGFCQLLGSDTILL